MRSLRRALFASCVLAALALAADEVRPPQPVPLVIVDSAGKEQKAKLWKITQGLTSLTWLAQDDAPAKDKPKAKGKGRGKRAVPSVGPEAIRIREGRKINFAEGVLTYVPLTQVAAIEFDSAEKTMTVKAAIAGKDEPSALTGTTAYKGINKVTVEAEVNKGGAGVAAMTYQGGALRGGPKAFRFPSAKGVAPVGRPAVVQSSDKGIARTDKVNGLLPLYQVGSGRLVTDSTLLFKKTLRLDVATIRRLKKSPEESEEIVWSVAQKDGEEGTFTLLLSGTIAGQEASLQGFVGMVPEGWRYFPTRRVVSIEFDQDEVLKGIELKMPRELKE